MPTFSIPSRPSKIYRLGILLCRITIWQPWYKYQNLFVQDLIFSVALCPRFCSVSRQSFRLQRWPSEHTGLPDGLFSDQNNQFGYILEGLGMENVLYILVISNVLVPSGIFNGHLVIL
jgi:hypothetical protein